VLHAVLGQGKGSLALDLKSPEGRDLALRLVSESDVVIENFAAGVMDRLGLGWKALAGLNPRLIYASLSGMGRSGPDAEMVAYGTLLQAYSGFSALNGFAGRQPTIGWAWTDPVCALVLTTAIAAALRLRAGTGRGCRIDASMAETMLWTMSGAIVHQQLHGEPPGREGNSDPRYFPHDVYRARGDDAWLAIAARDVREWAALCSCIPELAEFAALELDGRIDNGPEIDAAITAWAALRAPGEAASLLQEHGVPAASSASAAKLLASEHLGQRGFFAASVAGERPARLAAIPWLFEGERGRPLDPAGPLGSDTDAVLLEFFGYDTVAVQALRAAGVVA
jgi:benzylsuccinate CoA-transferase BbsF subunit